MRAGLLAPEQALENYRWSSYPLYLAEPAKRPHWLRVDRLFGECGVPKDSLAGRQEFSRRVEARRRAEAGGEYEPVGWCGERGVPPGTAAQVSGLATLQDGGEEIRQSALAKAERIANGELKALGWSAQDLQGRPKGDARKVRIAARLRRETTMTLEWIAQRLCMGAATHVASLLQHYQEKGLNSGETLF